MTDSALQPVAIVVGSTGLGKSTLIGLFCKDPLNKPVVNESVDSVTTQTQDYLCTAKGRDFILYDTPGFGDSEGRDQIFLDQFVDTLQKHGKGISKLLFCITNSATRFDGFIKGALKIFRDLMPNVMEQGFMDILVTQTDSYEKRWKKEKIDQWQEKLKTNFKSDVKIVFAGQYYKIELEEYLAVLSTQEVYQTSYMQRVATIETQLKKAAEAAQSAKSEQEQVKAQVQELQLRITQLQNEKDEKEKMRSELQKQLDNARTEGSSGSGGCFDLTVEVETETGIKKIGDLNYGDKLKTPRGWSAILYLKDYEGCFDCVRVKSCILTVDHLVYDSHGLVCARELCPGQKSGKRKVRAVVVKGDSFFCGGLLVSSHTHFPWLTFLSPMIDLMSPTVIRALDYAVIAALEQYFG